MEKKNKRKSSILLVLLLLVAVVGVVSYTYAKYVASASAAGTMTAAAFAVKVNDVDLSDGTAGSVTLTATPETSANVTSGKIAPGSTFTTTITIDGTGSEVSLAYDISSITISDANVSGLGVSITSVAVQSGTVTDATSTTSSASGVIPLANVSTPVVLIITGVWTDDGSGSVDTGAAGDTISLSASVTVSQYIAS